MPPGSKLTGRAARSGDRLREDCSRGIRCFLLVALVLVLVALPVSAGAGPAAGASPSVVAPQVVNVSIYVVDFKRVNLDAGTVGADFYLSLKSGSPIAIEDIELMNGLVSSVDTIRETPLEKEYRVLAVLTVDPDLSRYPFDRHSIPLRIEPRIKNEQEMVFVIDKAASGFNPHADIPGWEFTGARSGITNNSYIPGEVPYSQAFFEYGISRDVTSTVLKFFLPILLIVLVSLSSLMMKVTSRLGLNASMFLAAVLIHWRVADAIPLVAYATFLDLFMIVTYATLVMVLISGILILKFMETKDLDRVARVNYWSIRIIPTACFTLYFLLFLSLRF